MFKIEIVIEGWLDWKFAGEGIEHNYLIRGFFISLYFKK